MKKLIQTLFTLGAFGAATMLAHAQSAPRIVVVNMAKIFDNHYETVEQSAKLKADTQKAQDEIDQLNKEGQALVEQYKELDDQAKNPTATAEAKAKAQGDAQQKMREIQAKTTDINNLVSTAKQSFQQRIQTFRTGMMERISAVAVEVAKRKGATMILDNSGPAMSVLGVAPVVYADPSYDITDEVIAEINRTRPAAMPAIKEPAPAPAASNSGSTNIVVPGITPKN